jgi:hypothetical protein
MYIYVYMCTYICIYIYIYTYICIYKYIFIHIHIHIYIYISIYILLYVYIYTYLYIYMYIYIDIHTCMFIYINIYLYIYIYIYIYIYMYVYIYVYIYLYIYVRANCVGGKNSLIQYKEFFVTRIQTFDCKMHRGSLNIRKFQTRVHSCTRFSISNIRIPTQEYTISNRVCLCMSTTHDSKPCARTLPYISNTTLSYTYILSTHVQ